MINFSNIKVLIFDCDGTLTNGIYQISENTGTVTKSFYTRDFYAIEQVLRNGLQVMIVTQSHDRVMYQQLQRICNHSKFWLDMWCTKKLILMEGVDNKEQNIFDELLDRKFGWDNVAYMGDAENDIPSIKKALFTGCPSDAIEEVKENSNYISDFPGGKGAVYDFCMYIYNKNDKENR